MPSLIKRVKSIFKSNSKKDASKQKSSSSLTPVAEAAPKIETTVPTVSTPKATSPAHPKNDHEKHTLAALLKSDAQLAASGLANSPYAKPASNERVQAAKSGLEAKGFKVHLVQNKGEAFETLKSLIPKGAS
ncbi:hypothetical protein BGW41_003072, partial [Actinomortierella wolfii]